MRLHNRSDHDEGAFLEVGLSPTIQRVSAMLVALAGAALILVTANCLWYDRPAETWMTEALPIGNGRMGAMLFGGTDIGRIQFNEIMRQANRSGVGT